MFKLTEECEDEKKDEDDDHNEDEAEVEGVRILGTQIGRDLEAQDVLGTEQEEHSARHHQSKGSLEEERNT